MSLDLFLIYHKFYNILWNLCLQIQKNIVFLRKPQYIVE